MNGSHSQLPASNSQPDLLHLRHSLLKLIRHFFYLRDYLEVETPNVMRTAPPDPNIDPLEVYVGLRGPFYLHTSPEMGMKKLLPHGHDRIFQICKVYRVEEVQEVHSIEFTMLEWYRPGTYEDTMREVEELIRFVVRKLPVKNPKRFKAPWRVYELTDLFVAATGINPFGLERDDLFAAMKRKGFPGIDGRDTWNDLFFKLFIQEVEPHIREETPYFIKDWPVSVSTMAKRKDESRVERFELYIDNLEIANGYTELLNVTEQKERFLRDYDERQASGKPVFPIDDGFLDALGRLHGSYTGVSVGVDRLLMAFLGKKRISDVLFERLIG